MTTKIDKKQVKLFAWRYDLNVVYIGVQRLAYHLIFYLHETTVDQTAAMIKPLI